MLTWLKCRAQKSNGTGQDGTEFKRKEPMVRFGSEEWERGIEGERSAAIKSRSDDFPWPNGRRKGDAE